jgi:SAM-dependent methyltransferase
VALTSQHFLQYFSQYGFSAFGSTELTFMGMIEDIVKAANTPPAADLRQEISETLARFRRGHLFVKSLPLNAKVLDMGAGNGSLVNVAKWLEPERYDLNFYAASLEVGEFFHLYKGYEIGNFDIQPPAFEGITFDAIFASHFIEHVDDPKAFFSWGKSRLKPGGLLFVECPAAGARTAPTRAQLEDAGIAVVIGNYFDDFTHKGDFQLDDSQLLQDAVRDSGYDILEYGSFHAPMIEDALFYFGRERNDLYLSTMGLWSKTRWAHHIIASARTP